MYKNTEGKYEKYSIALLIKIINEAFEKKANRILRQYNLTFSQARILICLSPEGEEGHSLKELEKCSMWRSRLWPEPFRAWKRKGWFLRLLKKMIKG